MSKVPEFKTVVDKASVEKMIKRVTSYTKEIKNSIKNLDFKDKKEISQIWSYNIDRINSNISKINDVIGDDDSASLISYITNKLEKKYDIDALDYVTDNITCHYDDNRLSRQICNKTIINIMGLNIEIVLEEYYDDYNEYVSIGFGKFFDVVLEDFFLEENVSKIIENKFKDIDEENITIDMIKDVITVALEGYYTWRHLFITFNPYFYLFLKSNK